MRIIVLLALLSIVTPGPAFAAQPQAITINSRLVAHVRPLPAPAGTPAAFASVLLVPGSNGTLGLSPDGDVLQQQQNFLIRSAYRFLVSGLNVAMLDSDPVFPEPNGFTNQRHTQQHADLLAKTIELVRTEWPTLPVWVVGTANSTISVVNLAARFANSQLPLKGIILTSSVTMPNTSPGGEHHDVMSLNPGLSRITIPTLVIWHKGDACPTSPGGNAGAVFTALTNVATANKAEVVIDKGGWAAMPPCSSLAYHGYNGAEDEVVATIAKFIAAHL
jgi:pimeloyl-ACP methyl ester carboxylesterase